MKKKIYIRPQMEVVNIKMSSSLLIVSEYDVNEEEMDAGNAL